MHRPGTTAGLNAESKNRYIYLAPRGFIPGWVLTSELKKGLEGRKDLRDTIFVTLTERGLKIKKGFTRHSLHDLGADALTGFSVAA